MTKYLKIRKSDFYKMEAGKMIVTAWNNGTPNNKTGAGYGVKIKREDRDKYFQRTWSSVIIELNDEEVVNVKLSNSFWKNCTELRSAKIGKWMLDNGIAPWPKGRPPVLKLEPIDDRKFRLSFI